MLRFAFRSIALNDRIVGRWVVLVLAAFLTTVLLSPAEARSPTCNRLERQLASLDNSSGGTSSRYKAAIRSQNAQISKVRKTMRSRGCKGTKRLFQKEAHSSCRGLRSTLQKMKRNLKSLNRKAKGLSGGSGTVKRTKRRLQRAIKRHRCHEDTQRQAKLNRSTLVEQIFGQSAAKKRRQQAQEGRRALRKENHKKKRIVSTEERLKNYNTVRTICVRRCDGYYFPVSFSTKRGSMVEDAEACTNLCPGTEMELFYHKAVKETTEQMISTVDGQPYTSLPNAFAYRERYDASCTCNYRLLAREPAEKTVEKLTRKQIRDREQAAIARIASPAWRLDLGQDPETLDNSNGGIDLTEYRNLDDALTENQIVAKRKVRVIGEAFLPAQ